MKQILVVLSMVTLVNCSSTDNTNQGNTESEGKKSGSIAEVKSAPFIRVALKVRALSSDSILVKTTITNNWNKDFVIYKPFLPTDTNRADVFSVLSSPGRNTLAFNGDHLQGNYLKYADGPSDFLIPDTDPANLITLQPKQTLEFESNIAHKYRFEEYLEKGIHDFSVTYFNMWPYIVDRKQVTEIDSVYQESKPVYYSVSMPENDDPDSMRVYFKIP